MSQFRHKILLFNPRSANSKHRFPNSILQVAASVFNKLDIIFVDGNLEDDPWIKISNYMQKGEIKYFGCTVMPGPQLKQAIPLTKKIKAKYPVVITIWGGYFPSNHFETAIKSGYVDYIIRGPADHSFPDLIDCLENEDKERLGDISNLVFRDLEGNVNINPFACNFPLDNLAALPYEHLEEFYNIENYIGRTFMGLRTISYHSSMGCPHNCAFCAVASVYHGSWNGIPAKKLYEDICHFKSQYGIDAVEFHDNNFFASHSRIIEFCHLMKDQAISWWAEGRIDSLNRFSDEELLLLREAGCKMIFMGAESGDDQVLKQINKGGLLHANDTKELAEKFKRVGIVPELSFVLGFPDIDDKSAGHHLKSEFQFIREIKRINPFSEIIIYIYGPIPISGTELNRPLKDSGFAFPETLEDWLNPEWEHFDLWKNPRTPWLKRNIVTRISNFETVLLAAYPSVSNFRIKGIKRIILTSVGRLRYRLRWYRFPYLEKILLKIFNYHQAEKEGFYSE